jgi:SAM-dependent methyltransferase
MSGEIDETGATHDPRSTNLAYWEGLAALHGAGISGGYYDVDALVAGRNPIHEEVEQTLDAALGARSVEGLDVLHVQSHIAIDSVELARRGARVTCTDFSPEALSRAAEIAARSGVELELVEADSTALPPALHGRFDLAYATVGVLCWIGDLDAWMESVSACLRPGGRLLLAEIHPLYDMAESLDPLVLDLPYGFEAGGLTVDEPGSYADPDADLAHTRATVFGHSLGEIVTAAGEVGLRTTYLREYTELSFDPRGTDLTREDDGRYRWRLTGMPMPVFYGLVATKD